LRLRNCLTRETAKSERWRMINRARSRTRARGEHAFRVVKQLWGLRQGEIPRLGQEPGPSADHVRIGQPLPSSQTTASNSGPVRAMKNLRAISRPYRDHCRANPHAISVR
jgi:hypothetical protein